MVLLPPRDVPELSIRIASHQDPTQRLGHGRGAAPTTSGGEGPDGTDGTTAGVEEIKAHPFFGGIDWEKLLAKDPSIEPPFKPASSKSNPLLHFDKKMTAMKMTALSVNESPGVGGALAATLSRDPFADFSYDGVAPLPECEPEPEPEVSAVSLHDAVDHDSHAPPPIQDSVKQDTSEVGVPPVLTSTVDGTGGQEEGRTSPQPSGATSTTPSAPASADTLAAPEDKPMLSAAV
jgi:hypothetical protein